MAGRRSGYVQVLVALAGMGLTLVFGILFLAWCILNLEQIRAPEADPYVTLAGIWRQLRWALLGIGLFAVAWLWALVTSFAILKTSPRN
jgi:hypothetical protein